MKDKGEIFCNLVHLAGKKGISVSFFPFQVYDGRVKEDKIGIRQDLSTIDEYNYNLAHELAHVYLHFDKGNLVNIDASERAPYEEQADRTAKMILDILSQ